MSFLAQAVKLAAGAAPNGLPIRFDGGPTFLAEALAARLEGRVRLDAEVVAVEQDRTAARVVLADGTDESAERVVLALPLPLERRLRFDAPQHRRLAYEEARYGDAVKGGLLYEGEPPGESVSADGVFFVPDAGQPVLAFFAGSHAARRLAALDAEERRWEVARLAGGRPLATAAVVWADEPYTRGSYLILGPGHLTRWGRRLADAHGRVHFAGAEASTLRSYMESAVRAGERAAGEVLAALE
jgi:monoamine oxidase